MKTSTTMPVAARLQTTKVQLINLIVISIVLTTIAIDWSITEAFHLSFGHRLLRSAKQHQSQQQHSNPQLNPASSLIRPIECRNANNHSEAGICMFSIDCMQNKGVPLSICKHNYFVGTCCRLPDYNNFVGIVYDLRDTETLSSQLEARRATPTSGPNATTIAIQTSSTTTSSPAASSAASTTTTTTTTTKVPQSNNSEAANNLLTNQLISSIQQQLESTSERPDQLQQQQQQSTARLEDKYVISSTSLFASPTSPPPPTNASPSSSSSSSPPTASAAVESARNADGKSPDNDQTAIKTNFQQLVDTFQIQLGPGASSSPVSGLDFAPGKLQVAAAANSSAAYELIRGPDDAAADQTVEVVSSAHSAATPKQPPSTQLPEESPGAHRQSTTLTSTMPTTAASPSSTTTTTTTTTTSTTLASSISSTSQEFAVSGRDEPTASTTTAPASTAASTATVGLESSASTGSSSPFVDLVSTSNQSQQQQQEDLQTTTPFTSSLSTALLPNISSHPYSPTTPATPELLVSSSSSSSSSQQQHQDSNIPLVSTTPSGAKQPTKTQQQQQTNTPPSPTSESVPNFSQLYNNQHSSSATATATATAHNNNHQVLDHPLANNANHHSLGHHLHQSRPGGGSSLNGAASQSPLSLATGLASSPSLQAASSKIVSGGGPSHTNNLIPGLGGLQSAILSHIPFKLASGLSSGLSNYLQAAMKPTGSRPLISSNTAPALQYQHQHHHQQQQQQSVVVNSTSRPSLVTAIRFPGSGIGESSSSTTTSAVPPAPLRDFVKEAQLVCGKPQVLPASSSATGGSSIFGSTGTAEAALQQQQQSAAKRRVGRIVGGNQSLFGQWPWMVSLRQWRKGAFLHKCGAALLNENWAITAAHCVENVKASDLLLRLGEFDVSKQDEPYPYMERRVKTVVSHPSFDPKTFEYDLALLRFTEPIQFERNILPVCVPNGNDTYVDRMATVIGWGRLYEDGPLPDIIQHVDVPIITNNECEKMYKNAGYIEEIPDMFICAGINKGGRDSCEGDSGGPLTMVDHDGRSYLVGIISWGIGCALPSQPGVYTRITAFSGWINDIILN